MRPNLFILVFTFLVLSHTGLAASATKKSPARGSTAKPSGTTLTPGIPEDDEEDDEDSERNLKGAFVQSEEQAKKEAPDLIKKFATPANAWGVGISAPEVLTFDYFRLFTPNWGMRVSLAPPIPFKVAVQQEVQSETVDTRLQVATPATTSYLNALYGPHLSVDALYFPVPTSTFYFSGGLGYRRISVKGDLSSPVYVCYIEASETCDESTRFIDAGSNMEITSSYQATSIMWRVGTGWFFPLKHNQYLHINVFGLTKAIRTYRKVSVDAGLDRDLPAGTGSKALESTNKIMSDKSGELEDRTIDRAALIENVAIPTIGVGTGWTF